jgi:hypothetical protein
MVAALRQRSVSLLTAQRRYRSAAAAARRQFNRRRIKRHQWNGEYLK